MFDEQIEQSEQEQFQEHNQPTPSSGLQKKIEKLIADDAAQQKRTWSYYQEIKKTNRDAFLSPKIQAQMEKDALALGDAFVDGDFND